MGDKKECLRQEDNARYIVVMPWLVFMSDLCQLELGKKKLNWENASIGWPIRSLWWHFSVWGLVTDVEGPNLLWVVPPSSRWSWVLKKTNKQKSSIVSVSIPISSSCLEVQPLLPSVMGYDQEVATWCKPFPPPSRLWSWSAGGMEIPLLTEKHQGSWNVKHTRLFFERKGCTVF